MKRQLVLSAPLFALLALMSSCKAPCGPASAPTIEEYINLIKATTDECMAEHRRKLGPGGGSKIYRVGAIKVDIEGFDPGINRQEIDNAMNDAVYDAALYEAVDNGPIRAAMSANGIPDAKSAFNKPYNDMIKDAMRTAGQPVDVYMRGALSVLVEQSPACGVYRYRVTFRCYMADSETFALVSRGDGEPLTKVGVPPGQ